MLQAWADLDAWLSANAPDAYAALNEAASEEDLASAEQELGLSMPPSLRESYLVHDGEAEDSAGVFDSWQLLSLERVVEHWREFVQLHEQAEPGAWGDGEFDAKSSIPVMWFESAIRYIKAESGGREGAMYELPRHGKPIRLAGSFGEYLEGLHRQLVSGQLIVEPDFGFNVVPPGASASGA